MFFVVFLLKRTLNTRETIFTKSTCMCSPVQSVSNCEDNYVVQNEWTHHYSHEVPDTLPTLPSRHTLSLSLFSVHPSPRIISGQLLPFLSFLFPSSFPSRPSYILFIITEKARSKERKWDGVGVMKDKEVKLEDAKTPHPLVEHHISVPCIKICCLLRRNKARSKQKTFKSVGVMED